MSGLEVAGLILGAFPIALEVLDRYKEVAKVCGFWYRIAAEHKKCDSQIKFHRLVYVNNLKRLLLPLAGLDDARIDELLKRPGGSAWTDPKITEVLKRRLTDSYELYLQHMDDFQESLRAMNRELAFDPATKQRCQEPSSTTQGQKPRSRAEILKDKGKWQIYRVKFSQAEKERSEIFAKLEGCNDRLKTLLQISEDNDQLARERISSATKERSTICRFWSQAGRVFTALSTVWNCSCRAQHSTRLLLEHRTSTATDFHLLYEKGLQRPGEARRIIISSKGAGVDNSAAIRLSSRGRATATPGHNPSNRISTPTTTSAKKKNVAFGMDGLGMQPTITVTQSEHMSASTSASISLSNPITTLCYSLEASDDRLCGFLREDDYRYYVYQEAVFCSGSRPKTITLDQLLQKDGARIPSRRQRVALGLILSSSFLQLLESPWLPASWQKSDIVFFEDPDRPGVFMFDRPHLRNSLERGAGPRPPPTETGRRMQLSSSLEMLGVVLLELCFGQLLGAQPCRLRYSDAGDGTIVQRALDIQAAREWHADVEEEAGYEYSVAVGWCLGGILSTPPDRWREVMLCKVVDSLESCHRHLQQKGL